MDILRRVYALECINPSKGPAKKMTSFRQATGTSRELDRLQKTHFDRQRAKEGHL